MHPVCSTETAQNKVKQAYMVISLSDTAIPFAAQNREGDPFHTQNAVPIATLIIGIDNARGEHSIDDLAPTTRPPNYPAT
jgi:hypothetical protein